MGQYLLKSSVGFLPCWLLGILLEATEADLSGRIRRFAGGSADSAGSCQRRINLRQRQSAVLAAIFFRVHAVAGKTPAAVSGNLPA